MNIACNNNINFKSGLTKEILEMERKIKPGQVENYFRKTPYRDWQAFYRIDLKGNKTHAIANRLCADVFKNLRKIYDLRQGLSMQKLILPQDLYVFNRDASDDYKDMYFFSNCTFWRPEKNKPTFDVGTVFMPNDINSLKIINGAAERAYEEHRDSAPHFLLYHCHEWLHALYFKLVQSMTFISSYHYNTTMQNYQNKELTPEEKEIVASVLGTYPTTVKYGQYPECYACAWSKFICEALAPDCRTFAKNPIDLMKKTPKEFQDILKKVTDIKMLHLGETE